MAISVRLIRVAAVIALMLLGCVWCAAQTKSASARLTITVRIEPSSTLVFLPNGGVRVLNANQRADVAPVRLTYAPLTSVRTGTVRVQVPQTTGTPRTTTPAPSQTAEQNASQLLSLNADRPTPARQETTP